MAAGFLYSFRACSDSGTDRALLMHEAPSIAESLRMRKSGQKKVIYHQGQKMRLIDVLKFKNVTVSTANSIPVMVVLWVYTGFSALFLFKVHQFSMGQVGIALAASGAGGCLGVLSMGGLSDHIGRKTAMIIAGLLCAAAGAAVALLPVGTPLAFFSRLSSSGVFGIGTFPLYLGTLPTECVPPECAELRRASRQGLASFSGISHACPRRISCRQAWSCGSCLDDSDRWGAYCSYFSLLCGNGTAKGSKNENQTLRRRLLTAAFQGKTAECNAVRFICYFND